MEYLKIEITYNFQMIGKELLVYENDEIIWGTIVENPENNKIISYRNIVVKCRENVRVVFDNEFKVTFQNTPFNTEKQKKYDQEYSIISDNNIHYALSGNQVNPIKILVTFPGFMFSTSEIQYPITAFKSVVSNPMISSNYLVLAFQDRFFSSGTYMLFDEYFKNIDEKICKVISRACEKYGLKEEDIILFGASKGGTIAINISEYFKKAKTVISVPQINILNYVNTNQNLSRAYSHLFGHVTMPDILSKLERSMEKGGVHYIYSPLDSPSNDEFNFDKYREKVNNFYSFRLAHGQVTRFALDSILAILLDELNTREVLTTKVTISRIFMKEDGFNMTLIVDEMLDKQDYKAFHITFVDKNNAKKIYPLVATSIAKKTMLKVINESLVDLNKIDINTIELILHGEKKLKYCNKFENMELLELIYEKNKNIN